MLDFLCKNMCFVVSVSHLYFISMFKIEGRGGGGLMGVRVGCGGGVTGEI